MGQPSKRILSRSATERADEQRELGQYQAAERISQRAPTLLGIIFNAVATSAPEWLQARALAEWYKRYGRRSEDDRLPENKREW